MPSEGTFNAKLYFVDGKDWPCLVETQRGIGIPRQRPVRDKDL